MVTCECVVTYWPNFALQPTLASLARLSLACVPGMSQCLEVKVLCPARWRRRAREAQGRHREVGSEGSVERTRGARNTNRIRGVTVLGRVGTRPQSPPSAKGLFCKSGVDARTGLRLTPGELREALGSGVPRKVAEGGESFSDRPAAVSRGHSPYRLPIGKARTVAKGSASGLWLPMPDWALEGSWRARDERLAHATEPPYT